MTTNKPCSWRMGLPLELVVLAVSVPMLLVVWPL